MDRYEKVKLFLLLLLLGLYPVEAELVSLQTLLHDTDGFSHM